MHMLLEAYSGRARYLLDVMEMNVTAYDYVANIVLHDLTSEEDKKCHGDGARTSFALSCSPHCLNGCGWAITDRNRGAPNVTR